MKKYMSVAFVYLVVLVTNVTFFALYCPAQEVRPQFKATVSDDDRRELVNRLALYVKYQRQRAWGDLHDLIDDRRDKGSFVRAQRKNPNDSGFWVKGFSSIVIVRPDPQIDGWLIVEACTAVRDSSGNTGRFRGLVNAFKVRGQWIFTLVELTRPIGEEPRRC